MKKNQTIYLFALGFKMLSIQVDILISLIIVDITDNLILKVEEAEKTIPIQLLYLSILCTGSLNVRGKNLQFQINHANDIGRVRTKKQD